MLLKNVTLVTFNDHYINIVKRFPGEKPRSYISGTNLLDHDEALNEIVLHCSTFFLKTTKILKSPQNYLTN